MRQVRHPLSLRILAWSCVWALSGCASDFAEPELGRTAQALPKREADVPDEGDSGKVKVKPKPTDPKPVEPMPLEPNAPPPNVFKPVVRDAVLTLDLIAVRPDLSSDYVIGYRHAGETCPQPDNPNWVEYDLFGSRPVYNWGGSGFCAYKRQSPSAKLQELPDYCPGSSCRLRKSLSEQNWLEPVTEGLTKSGAVDEAKGAIAQVFRARFREQLEVPASMPEGTASAAPVPDPTPNNPGDLVNSVEPATNAPGTSVVAGGFTTVVTGTLSNAVIGGVAGSTTGSLATGVLGVTNGVAGGLTNSVATGTSGAGGGASNSVNVGIADWVVNGDLEFVEASPYTPPVTALPAPVTVWVLDDASGEDDPDGHHGRAVGQLIKQNACASGACAVTVRYVDVFESGATATASTLALARAIVNAADAPGRNIINISLGVHARRVWANPPDSRGELGIYYIAYDALVSAINYAGCKGALVVAAIGNRDGGDQETNREVPDNNALYPGAWSNRNHGWTCSSQPQSRDRALVLGVGAIGPTGEDSPTMRPNGRAEFVAPGYAVTLNEAGEGQMYWEGSSFASAAASAVAAAAWSYAPTLPALPESNVSQPSLYGLLRDHARRTRQIRTHICHEDGECDLKEVAMCPSVNAALAYTCATQGAGHFSCNMALSCPTPVLSQHWPTLPPSPAIEGLLLASENAQSVSWDSADDPGCALPAAGYTPQGYESNPQGMCPFEHIGNGQARDDKMCRSPGDLGPCQYCLLTIKNDQLKFIGTLDPVLRASLNSATIRVRIPPTDRMYFAPDGPVHNNDYFEVHGLLSSSEDDEIALDLTDLNGSLPADASFDFVVEEDGVTQALSSPLPIVVLP